MSMQGQAPAVCHRCGARKRGPLVPCKACGVVPTREARAVAWLFSENHLTAPELAEAERRLRAGEVPAPPRALCVGAQRAMGSLDAPSEEDRPPSRLWIAGLVAGQLLLTPLLGAAVWLGYRETRPTTARVALWTMWPVLGVLALLWGIDRWG